MGLQGLDQNARQGRRTAVGADVRRLDSEHSETQSVVVYNRQVADRLTDAATRRAISPVRGNHLHHRLARPKRAAPAGIALVAAQRGESQTGALDGFTRVDVLSQDAEPRQKCAYAITP